MFKAVCYRPDESQIITAGTDRKVRVLRQFSETRQVPNQVAAKYFV